MKTLKKMIRKSLYIITGISVIILLFVLLCMHIMMGNIYTYDEACKNIQHIKSLMMENQEELQDIKEEYRETCIHNAETVARIIESAPEVMNNVSELKEIAASVEIGEIHIIDSTGRIFSGTHPIYYNYTFDSGSQMNYFKPMLKDHKLRMVQDITPNTAESKPMQYSAVWSESEKYIVQVGMEPVNVDKIMKKNELSHVFSHFRLNPEVNYYAIRKDSGEIIGSTYLECVEKNIREIGGSLMQISENTKGFYAKINGRWSYCVFKLVDQNYVGQVVTVAKVFQRVPGALFWAMICLLVISLILVHAVAKYLDRHVIEEMDKVNSTLQSITDGNLEERLNIKSSEEFVKLSSYINLMVNSILENNEKMSYALSKTNMFIGTYEYGNRIKGVHYTEYIPTIFSLSQEKIDVLAKDKEVFINFLDTIKKCEDKANPGVYMYEGKFIRIEEIEDEEKIFGVAVDITAEIMAKKEIEKERDIDALTGLYNRRALDKQLEGLFMNQKKLKHAAVVMIDADGLKSINDNYGHEQGDKYLKTIASVLQEFSQKDSVVARQGGDEYVLFLYGYESSEELKETIDQLEQIQDKRMVQLGDEIQVPLSFSFGYCMVNGQRGYQSMIKEADRKMYHNKMKRKKTGVENR